MAGLPASAMKSASRASWRRGSSRPCEHVPVQGRGAFRVAGPLENLCEVRLRVCHEPRRRSRVGDFQCPAVLRFGPFDVSAYERGGAQARQRERGVFGEAGPLRALESSTERSRCHEWIAPLLRQPRLEQRCRDGTNVVVLVQASCFGGQGRGHRDVPLCEGADGPGEGRRPGSPSVPEVLEAAPRLLREGDRALGGPGAGVCEGKRQPGQRGFPGRLAMRSQLESALAYLDSGLEILLLRREVAQVREKLDAERRRRIVCELQRGFRELPSLRDALGGAEVPPEPHGETGRNEAVGTVAGVGERRPEVVVLPLETLHPPLPLRLAQAGARAVGQRREVLRVCLSGSVEAAALLQLRECVLADGVEQVVARLALGERRQDDRFVDQCLKQVGDHRLVELVGRSDGEQRRERGAAVHGKLVQQRLLVAVQKLVAPFDEAAESVAARLGADPVLEQREAALDDRVELREAEHVDAGGGELDRQRQPVHAARDVGHQRSGVLGQLEVRTRGTGARREQLHRW